jgi:hypothetical protein
MLRCFFVVKMSQNFVLLHIFSTIENDIKRKLEESYINRLDNDVIRAIWTIALDIWTNLDELNVGLVLKF